MKTSNLLWGLILSFVVVSAYADSALRIKCFDEAEGAEVYIDGKFKTNCPASVFVPAGDVNILIRKSIDQDHEMLFTQQMRLGDGAVATLEAKLSPPQLTAEATKRKQASEASQVLEKAKAGDVTAMREMSSRYSKGLGVEENALLAKEWLQKADAATVKQLQQEAEAGNLSSMATLADRYDAGNGVVKDVDKASYWRNKKQSIEQQTQAKKREADKQARILALEKEQFSHSKDYIVNGLFMGDPARSNPLTATLLTLYSPLFLPTSFLTDLSQLPGQKAEIEKLRKEASVLPAKWGAPDSMIAHATIK